MDVGGPGPQVAVLPLPLWSRTVKESKRSHQNQVSRHGSSRFLPQLFSMISSMEAPFFSKLLLVGVLFTATEKQTRGASKEIVCGIKLKVSPLWKHFSRAKSWGKAGQSIQSCEGLSTR